MKKCILMFLWSGLVFFSVAIFATSSQTITPNITLYSQPSHHSEPVATLSPEVPLVKIVTNPNDNNWIKVGAQTDGAVGWLNLKDYENAKQAYEKLMLQVKLYKQPNTHSAVVGTITPQTPIVFIVHSEDGQWVKVGNQDTGEAGWMNQQDYDRATSAWGDNMSQKMQNTILQTLQQMISNFQGINNNP